MTELMVLELLLPMPAVVSGQGEGRAGTLMKESTDAKPEMDGSIGFILYLEAAQALKDQNGEARVQVPSWDIGYCRVEVPPPERPLCPIGAF